MHIFRDNLGLASVIVNILPDEA